MQPSNKEAVNEVLEAYDKVLKIYQECFQRIEERLEATKRVHDSIVKN